MGLGLGSGLAKLAPDWPKAHGRLGNALVGLFELERAAVAFEQAATLTLTLTLTLTT